MLTIDEVRKLIDGDKEYTDEQVAEIRDASQGLVELAFEIIKTKKRQIKTGDKQSFG